MFIWVDLPMVGVIASLGFRAQRTAEAQAHETPRYRDIA